MLESEAVCGAKIVSFGALGKAKSRMAFAGRVDITHQLRE